MKEYCKVYFDEYVQPNIWIAHGGTTVEVIGKATDLMEVMNRLGREGWKYKFHYQGKELYDCQFFFERTGP